MYFLYFRGEARGARDAGLMYFFYPMLGILAFGENPFDIPRPSPRTPRP